jgi:alpha/beta superfamily hydrolase
MALMIQADTIQLEAQIREPKEIFRGAVVVCHPHPVYGGTMDNRVVYRAAKAVSEAGFVALRFNFRGVGGSTGQFDHGIGEKDDVVSAIDWLEKNYPGLPLALAGYSFGAWVGLQVGCADRRIRALTGLGLPLDMYDFGFLIDNSKPALYIVGDRDEFCSKESLQQLAVRLPSASMVRPIENAEHFFTGHVEVVEKLIFDFFRELQLDEARGLHD